MNRQYVNSSNIESIGYDEESLILEIGFLKGGIYKYFGVPISEYNALMSASSHGSYFYHNIRDNYDYMKIG